MLKNSHAITDFMMHHSTAPGVCQSALHNGRATHNGKLKQDLSQVQPDQAASSDGRDTGSSRSIAVLRSTSVRKERELLVTQNLWK